MASKFAKTFGQIAQWGLPIAGALTGNPLLAAGGGALGGALSGKKGTLKQAGIGAAGGYLGSKFLGSNPLSKLGGMFGQGGGTPVGGGMVKGMGGMPTSATGSNLTSQVGAMIPQMSSKGGFGFGGLGGSLTKNPLLLGSSLMGASQFLRSPKVPELPQSVVDFQNTARQGNPLQNQAAGALSQQLGQTQQNLGQPEIDAINRQYDLAQQDELKSVDSLYKSLRPGTDPLTDTSYQKDLGRVRDRYATLRSDSVAQAQRQISNDFASQRANQIAQAAGLSQQQLSQLQQSSQYDIDRVLAQFNLQDRDREFLRNYLLQFGGDLAASQLGVQTNPLRGLAGLFGGGA